MKISFYMISVTGLAILISLSACMNKKETVINKTIPPVTVTASKSKEQAAEYRPSYKKVLDILHTRLEISFNWDSSFAYGKAILTCKPYFYPLSEAVIDAKGFRINEVSLIKDNQKINVPYRYDGSEISVQLGRPYTRDDTLNLYIDYVAMPDRLKKGGSAAITSDKGLYFINPKGEIPGKPRQIWTQGETEATSCWLPTIDGPQEKMTQELYITIDSNFLTISNGRMEYSTDNGNGTRTDYWVQDLPHSTYLVMMAIGEFAVVHDKWRDMEVNYYVEPAYAPYARKIFGNTPEMLEFFTKKLGVDYVWDKYAQIVVKDFVSGAMENTSAVLFFEQMQKDDRELLDNNNEDIISHELFHHWFGDLVTAESWANLPLNESFATYGEYLWQEYKYGRDAADRIGQNDLNAYLRSAKSKQVDLIRFQYDDPEDMFDTHSYQKGGRVLHMLRKYVGDEAFFESLKVFLEKHKFSTAEIHDLRLAFEQVTGEDLNWFFNQWFLASGHADITYDYAYDPASKKAMLTVTQNQDTKTTPIYRIPLDIDIYTNGKPVRKRVTVTREKDTFWFETPVKPDLINADAEKMLLGVKKDNKLKEEFIFQYRNAPLFMDRYEALENLGQHKSDPRVQDLFREALSDTFWAIRSLALDKVSDLIPANKEAAYQKIISLALADPKAEVRSKAVNVLSQEFKKDNMAIYRQTIKDSAYSVVANSLEAIAVVNTSEALTLARSFKTIKSPVMVISLGDLYAKYGSVEEHTYYLQNLTDPNMTSIYLLSYYQDYLERMDDQTIREGIGHLQKMYRNASGFFKLNTKAVISSFIALYDAKEKELSAKPDKAPELKKVQEMKSYISDVLAGLDADNK